VVAPGTQDVRRAKERDGVGAHSVGGRGDGRGRHAAASRRRSPAPGSSVALTAVLGALALGAIGAFSVQATAARPQPAPSQTADAAAGFPQPGPDTAAPAARARAVPATVGSVAALGPLEVLVTGIRVLDQEGTEGAGTRLAVDVRLTNTGAGPARSPWAEVVCGRTVGALDRQSTLPAGTELRPQETAGGALVVGVPLARCPGAVVRLVGAPTAGEPAPAVVLVVPAKLAQDFSR
jgi:hypothetical protein